MVKTRAAAVDLYGGKDPRDIPAYSFREVALSIGVPTSTVRAWCVGQSNFKSLLHLPAESAETHALSFFNLVEMQVIAELRRDYRIATYPSVSRSES